MNGSAFVSPQRPDNTYHFSKRKLFSACPSPNERKAIEVLRVHLRLQSQKFAALKLDLRRSNYGDKNELKQTLSCHIYAATFVCQVPVDQINVV
ncbi:Uncharacterized protein TCM_016388 [Theobroma cacao]|uniref:Uncharacterized protein n=1 Tax=Theobroma cacao TaxID=3641 RepID=A0A061G5R2_THECC|nr:Uncharacterized protein TCM_016388 [Theobroma cacao]